MPTTVVGWIVGSAPLGIVAFVIYAILGGRLVPKATVDVQLQDKDKQIEGLGQVVDYWREASLAKDEALTALIPMITEITENDKLILSLLGAIREVVDKQTREAP